MRNKKARFQMAAVCDYQSGVEVGRDMVDWQNYQIWKSGPSEVCEAHRFLNDGQIERFRIGRDQTVFAFEVEA